jgi:tetratricopeptide (TPR) repeat protein
VSAGYRQDPELASLAAPFLAIADSAQRGIGSARSRVQVANALVIRALLARSRGDQAQYRSAIEEAAKAEREFGAFVGPPERVFALELLGEALETEGRKAEAAEAYRTVLRLCPNRRRSVEGLKRAG